MELEPVLVALQGTMMLYPKTSLGSGLLGSSQSLRGPVVLHGPSWGPYPPLALGFLPGTFLGPAVQDQSDLQKVVQDQAAAFFVYMEPEKEPFEEESSP